MGNPFQVKLSQMLSAANTDLPRLEALLYLCCSHASLRCPYTQKSTSNRPGRIRWPRQRGRKFTDFHSL